MQNKRRLFLKGLYVASAGATAFGAYYLYRNSSRGKREALQAERVRMIEAIKVLETEGMIDKIGLPAFLTFWNDNVLQRLKSAQFDLDRVQREIVRSGTIFLPPATVDQIRATEQRVGLQFPPSLKAFLQQSNGVKSIVDYAQEEFDFLPCEKMAWLNEVDPGLIEIWNKEPFTVSDAEYNYYGKGQDPIKTRSEYLKHALVLSPVVDSGAYLLNPQIKFTDGEIEAWDFSVKILGAFRYKSFSRLLEEHCSRACHNLEYWGVEAKLRKFTQQ